MVNHIVTGEILSPGESNIDSLVEGRQYFVDKTLTIKQFLAGSAHQLVLRPRRCGKSHAISLLRAFLEAPPPNEVRPATLQIPFRGTLIDGDDHKELVKKHYKAYPILYMNLKDVRALSMDEIYEKFRSSLRIPMQFCRDELKLKNMDGTSLYSNLCQLIDQQGNWLGRLKSAPVLITEALHLIYGRRAVVLVDEYEAPLNHALERGYLTPASIFFGNMFSGLLKDNEHVQRSLMVGVLKMAKSGWLSGLNNIKVFSLNAEDPRYGDSFLFTEEEVEEFLLKTNSPLQLAELKKLYNSYYARGPGSKLIPLFNPWSVHNAIAEGQLACYWNQTSSYMPIRKSSWNRGPDFTDRVTKLLAGEEVKLEMSDTVSYEDLGNLGGKDLWGLLCYAGYLTPVSLERGRFRIPNIEVRQEWVAWLREFIQEKEMGNFNDIKTLLDPLLQGDAAEAQKALSKLLLEHFSYFLFDASLPEKVYRAFLFGLLLSEFGGKSYVVDIEKEAGYGRYDIRCWPTLQNHPIEIIIELKAVSLSKKSKNKRRVKKTRKELEKHMDQQLTIAMDQLESREYYLKSPAHITTVHEFGICFAGKPCVAGSRTRRRAGAGAAWTVETYNVPSAHFEESELNEQQYDPTVEERLEEEEERGQGEGGGVEPTSGSSSHHAAMEIEPAAATSPKKRNLRQRKDDDGELPNTTGQGRTKQKRY